MAEVVGRRLRWRLALVAEVGEGEGRLRRRLVVARVEEAVVRCWLREVVGRVCWLRVGGAVVLVGRLSLVVVAEVG